MCADSICSSLMTEDPVGSAKFHFAVGKILVGFLAP